jgi:hypothetical protein
MRCFPVRTRLMRSEMNLARLDLMRLMASSAQILSAAAVAAQDMSRRLRMQWPVITVYNFDLPAHDQSRRQQLPPDVLTIQQVLCLPEDPSIAKVLRNYLLDNESIERRVLVPVRPSLPREEHKRASLFLQSPRPSIYNHAGHRFDANCAESIRRRVCMQAQTHSGIPHTEQLRPRSGLFRTIRPDPLCPDNS